MEINVVRKIQRGEWSIEIYWRQKDDSHSKVWGYLVEKKDTPTKSEGGFNRLNIARDAAYKVVDSLTPQVNMGDGKLTAQQFDNWRKTFPILAFATDEQVQDHRDKFQALADKLAEK